MEVFEIDGKWYRKDMGNIILDCEKKEWVIKNSVAAKSLQRGIVGIKENGDVEIGYFSINPYNYIYLSK